uniref:Uncharacterized protein n=1 Tax=Tanacetum cinerariifolium TaxID=118510 RepID=A0A6L2MNH0_TANCI|nr:hypothetical protein [Tanacetum cinerariifolium]
MIQPEPEDLPRDIPLDSVEVVRYDEKRSKSEGKGKVPTEIELVLEQTQQGVDYTTKVGISSLLKCTFAIRQVAYVDVPDALVEYLQIGEKTSGSSLNTLLHVSWTYMERGVIMG